MSILNFDINDDKGPKGNNEPPDDKGPPDDNWPFNNNIISPNRIGMQQHQYLQRQVKEINITKDSDYKKLLRNKNWNYIKANREKVFVINTFDDGNDQYQFYPNEWIIFGRWKGKVALFNKSNPNVVITSISSWKAEQKNKVLNNLRTQEQELIRGMQLMNMEQELMRTQEQVPQGINQELYAQEQAIMREQAMRTQEQVPQGINPELYAQEQAIMREQAMRSREDHGAYAPDHNMAE